MSKQFSINSKLLTLQTGVYSKSTDEIDIFHSLQTKKMRVMTYRLIFIGFGILFTILSIILFVKTPNWSYQALFGYGVSTKTLLSLITLSLALAALWLGCSLRAEYELWRNLLTHSKKRLMKSYNQKTASLNGVTFNMEEQLKKEELQESFSNTYNNIKKISDSLHLEFEALGNSSYSETLKQTLKIEVLERHKQKLDTTLELFDQI